MDEGHNWADDQYGQLPVPESLVAMNIVDVIPG